MKSVFEERYNNLNDAQKRAVDAIEGPVLVVAGPGSGKTELLSLRVANILRRGNVGPQNILCLTFTETAALNMRQRLLQFIGVDAYRVGIFTFHAFCSHIISRFPEYFYNAAHFTNISDVVRAEVLESIFASLPHGHPLGSYHPEKGYVYLFDVKERIKHIKNGGYTPDEFRAALEFVISDYKDVHDALSAWPENMRVKASISEVESVYKNLLKLSENTTARALVTTLTLALQKAKQENKTASLTRWQNTYTVKDEGKRILKDFSKRDKAKALCEIYEAYTSILNEKGLYDYDDMIIEVSHALRSNEVLRAEVEEQYQYVLVDEFQDTNEAQMSVVRAITQNPVYEGRANVCVVGDDDQAVYKFQGAEVSHMMHFRDVLYKDVQTIVLDKNYRSSEEVLSLARSVIVQGAVRLENKYKDISKVLTAENKNLKKGSVEIASFVSDIEEYGSIAKKIRRSINEGENPQEIAIIAREHKHLQAILPFLDHEKVPYSYIKKSNVFEEKHIQELITICEYLSSGLSYEGSRNDLLPKILSFTFWEIPRTELFITAENVKKENTSWPNALLQSKNQKLKSAFELLATLSIEAKDIPLEHALDRFMNESGFKEYYFNEKSRKQNPQAYLSFLDSLKTFIDALREYKEGELLTIQDVAPYVEMHKGHKIPLISTSSYSQTEKSISLCTAHTAKGLEFGSVYIINADEKTWASGAKKRNKITLPLVLSAIITPAGDDEDDFIRLLYVAITRAKHTLYISSHNPHVRYLNPTEVSQDDLADKEEIDQDEITSLYEQSLSLVKAPYSPDEKSVFKSLLENYQMPVTHLSNFLNVSEGGPELFLQRNLLRFPEPLNPSGAYGSAVHKAIEKMIMYPRFFGGEKASLEHVLGVFDHALSKARLPKSIDFKERERGHALIEKYYRLRSEYFNDTDQVEVDMKNEGVIISDAHLTGKLDFVRVADTTIQVKDFKTGKAFNAWSSAKTDHEKIKLHNQKLQLIFYKLLIENSNRFKNFSVQNLTLEYVEGDQENPIIELSLIPESEDVAKLKKLIGIVYKKIVNLDFPDTSKYSKDYKGIIAFEQDLLNETI